jgi:UDP-N-acetylmuramate-alanine ligase
MASSISSTLDTSNLVVGTREAVIVLNPTKYTLKEDNEDEIQESIDQIDPVEIMPNLKLAYKERRRN